MSDQPAVTVDYERLTEVFAMVIEHLRTTRQEEAFTVEQDAFWSIPVAQMNDVYSEPELTIGRISETWESLQKMVAEDSAWPYGLIWIADVLRAVGNAAMR